MKTLKKYVPHALLTASAVLGVVAYANDATFMAYVGCGVLFLIGWDWEK